MTWTKTVKSSAPRIDWKTERERINLAEVATRLLGPHDKIQGRRLLWRCPFHDDRNPSFEVDTEHQRWACWPCGLKGDAASLVMRLEGKSFPEAVATLAGGSAFPSKAPSRPETKPKPKPPPVATGLPEADALAFVEAAEARLRSNDGRGFLRYLTGPRCLSVPTIQAARLGWTDGVMIPRRNGEPFHACGWVIPWFVGPRLALVKIRQPEGRHPKYAEAFRNPARLVSFPTATVRHGKPVVIVEGEFDALLLGEALGETATVLTLGGASTPLTPDIKSRFMTAPIWYVATDADPAGRLVLNVLMSVAQWEREAIGERTRDALAHKKSKGERVGQLPFGHKTEDGVNLVEDEAEQDAIKNVEELRECGLSCRAIAEEMNARGIKTKGNGKWHETTVRRILKRIA